LIELVIVLGITGLIFSGLWGLITSGSSQLQAQSAAQQYRQVIEATRKYITSGTPPYISTQLPGLVAPPPTVADLKAASLLPTNLSNQDAYGNTILIAVDTINADKQQWRFSVYASGTGLSDKIGAQVSSLIGSEGGFVYSNATDGCTGTVNATACGSFNSFTLPVADFGTAIDPGSGRIVTLSYTVDANAGTAPWLYRKAGDGGEQNTMSQNMFFNNGLSLSMQGSSIAMGTAIGTVGGGGKLTMNGGNFSMGADGVATGGGTLFMGAGSINDLKDVTGAVSDLGFTDVTLHTTQNITLNADSGTTIKSTAGALVSLDIVGVGKADEFQAGKFIYSSDFRMKENLVPIPDALQKVLLLRGYNYQWKGAQGHDIGLVAQDVEKVFPELVSKSADGKMGVDYPKMIAPVIEALRQLKEENMLLKAKLDRLEKQVEDKK